MLHRLAVSCAAVHATGVDRERQRQRQMHSPTKGPHRGKEESPSSSTGAAAGRDKVEPSMPQSSAGGIHPSDLMYRSYLGLNMYSQPLSMTQSPGLQQGAPGSYVIHPIYNRPHAQGQLAQPYSTFQGPSLNSPPSRATAGQQHNRIDPVDNVADAHALGAMQQRRKKIIKKAWTRLECILLLQCARRLIHCDLKTIAEAAYECIGRSAEICSNRAAEKKLKRMLHFNSWKKSNKKLILASIDKELLELDVKPDVYDARVLRVTEPLMGSMIIEGEQEGAEESAKSKSEDSMQLDVQSGDEQDDDNNGVPAKASGQEPVVNAQVQAESTGDATG